MNWRDRLLPASFRGVPFYVERHGVQGGRRLAVHEYPLRDLPYAEDLGRRARAYAIEAVLIGTSYDMDLSALRYALDTEGPGLLVHPVYGLLSVACQGYRATMTSAEGGAARVQLEFVEAGRNAFPLSYLDTLSSAVGKVTEIIGKVRSWVQVAYTIAALGGQVLAAATALLSALTATVDALSGQIGLSSADRAAQAAGLGTVQRELETTAAAPALVGALITDQVSSLRTLAGAPWAAYQALVPLTTWGADLPTVPVLTAAGAAVAANQAAIVGAVRDAAVSNACAAALSALAPAGDAAATAALPAGVPATGQEIRALQGTLLALIDVRQADASDALYQAWDGLRHAVARDLAERALVAPQARAITLAQTTPALVVGYRVHGDALRGAEIVRRNQVRHPGFVPGGVPLEVRV